MSPGAAGLAAHLPAFAVVAPLLAAPACVLVHEPRRAWWLALLVSVAALASGLGMLAQVLHGGEIVYFLGGWAAPWGIEYRVDALNALMVPDGSLSRMVCAAAMPAALAPTMT